MFKDKIPQISDLMQEKGFDCSYIEDSGICVYFNDERICYIHPYSLRVEKEPIYREDAEKELRRVRAFITNYKKQN